jgi:hypothetical protein
MGIKNKLKKHGNEQVKKALLSFGGGSCLEINRVLVFEFSDEKSCKIYPIDTVYLFSQFNVARLRKI